MLCTLVQHTADQLLEVSVACGLRFATIQTTTVTSKDHLCMVYIAATGVSLIVVVIAVVACAQQDVDATDIQEWVVGHLTQWVVLLVSVVIWVEWVWFASHISDNCH